MKNWKKTNFFKEEITMVESLLDHDLSKGYYFECDRIKLFQKLKFIFSLRKKSGISIVFHTMPA